MAKIEYARLAGQDIDIERALQMRDDAREGYQLDPDFRCPECHGAVRPHRAGRREPERHPAHFEHLERDSECKLSHRRRN